MSDLNIPEDMEIYLPDFDKIQTLDQMKAVFIATGFAFTPENPFFDTLQPFLVRITNSNREEKANDLRRSLEELGLSYAKKEESPIISLGSL